MKENSRTNSKKSDLTINGAATGDIIIEEEFIDCLWVKLPTGEQILLKNYLALYIMEELASLSEVEE